MKLGTDTGSLINYQMSRQSQFCPKIGDPATLLLWTDRNPATVIEVIEDKRIVTVQEDHAKRIDTNGVSEAQEYQYWCDPTGPKTSFRYDPKKGWRAVRKNERGRWVLTGSGESVCFGIREKYYDFSF